METFALIIDGKPRATREVFEVTNPSTGGLAGHAPLASLADLDDAVDAARSAFLLWRDVPDAERQAACMALSQCLADNSDELSRLLTSEQGKPLNGMGSRFELGGAQAWAAHTASLELPVKVLQDNNEGRVELYRKPIGVVGSITPWNWPLMIAVWHILPAIRAGNAVVIKPSPYTPLATLRMVELFAALLPKGLINCVSGGNEIGAAMSAHPGIDKIVFTGSSPTGRKVMASAAQTMKRLTLELGGNDAGIVLPDCNPEQIAEGLFWGAFINNGQTCAALKRLYVHDEIYDDVCARLAAYAETVPVGDGMNEANMLGPVQNRMQYDKVVSLVDDAISRGGRVLTGRAPRGDSLFFPPTLIAEVDNGTALVDDEQFGPVLPIIRYSDVDEVIARANDNANGLGGSIWSHNKDRAKELARRLECGSAWVNKHGAIQPNAPFGGVKASGLGVEFGEEGLHENTTIQVVYS